MKLGFDSLGSWEAMLSTAARRQGKYIILMIDNPERLDNQVAGVEEEWAQAWSQSTSARWHTYAGLLCLLGHFHESKIGVQVRYCVAAEQYFYLQERSSAKLKDFEGIQLIHWSSGDLLSALAHRYMVYLQLHPERRDEDKYRELLSIEIYTRDGALRFFEQLFEGVISNGRSHTEQPTQYMLRHTQLLPRQLIVYLNETMRRTLSENPKAKLTTLSAENLKRAIEAKEQLLAEEVIDSYRDRFPEAKAVISSLQNFPIFASHEAYKKSWKKFGAAAALKEYGHFPQVDVSGKRMMRLLFEVGVLGKALNTPRKNGYVNAEYEYTLPLELHVNPKEKLAVHPLFSRYSLPDTHAELDPAKGVYPRGCDVEEVLDREAIAGKYIHGKPRHYS
jgi:hypothetical protein